MPRRRQEEEDEEDRGWTEGWTRHVPPLLPQDPRSSQVPGEPHPEQPDLPCSPLHPPRGSCQTLPVALPRGQGRATRSPALQGPQGPQPPAGTQRHQPHRDSLTLPGLPRLRSGSCSSGELLSRGPSAPLPEATGPEESALGLRHKLPSGPPLSRDHAMPRAADGRALHRRRPFGHSGPGRGLRSSSSGVPLPASARPTRTLARTTRSRWLPAGPDGAQPRRPRNARPQEAKTREPRPAETRAHTGSERGAATMRCASTHKP